MLKKFFILLIILTAFIFCQNQLLPEIHYFLSKILADKIKICVDIAAIITAFGTMILALCALFALNQLNIMKKSNYLDSFKWIMDKLDEIKPIEEKLLKKELFLSVNLTEKDISSNNSLKHEVSQVINWYQRVAFMVNSGMLDKNYVRDMWGIKFVKIWHHFGRYIYLTREKAYDTSKPPYLRKDFEKLAIEFYMHFYFKHNEYTENLLKSDNKHKGYFDTQFESNLFCKLKISLFKKMQVFYKRKKKS